MCFGILGWSRERYLHASIEEFNESMKGYWLKWERQTAWMTREIVWTLILGNPNIPKEDKPKKKEDVFKLSDDKTKEIKVKTKRPEITMEDIKIFEQLQFNKK